MREEGQEMIKLTKEQEEAIEYIKYQIGTGNLINGYTNMHYFKKYLGRILNLIQEQQKENEKKDKIIKRTENYVKQEIKCYTESINDYIEDDKKANQNIINDLREDREHWKDIIKIINNQEIYMNWKEYEENQEKCE